MISRIVVHPPFDVAWQFAADHLRDLLESLGEVTLERIPAGGSPRPGPAVDVLFWLGAPLDAAALDLFPAVRQVHASGGGQLSPEMSDLLETRGISRLHHGSEGFWAQSVAEFALGLTIAALRRLPQRYHAMLSEPDAWEYASQQFSDDPAFTNGTIEGKRVRIVGAGNIASRYASFTRMLGADVAAWDPLASEPVFHRAGARREHHLARLVVDAEIFAPMVPWLPSTERLVSADIIRSLPKGCLVVLATRAQVCDMPELRRRVLADELSLAADVFEFEPVPFGDPLLGRHNVVHTPHIAGRTIDSNRRWAESLVEQLAP